MALSSLDGDSSFDAMNSVTRLHEKLLEKNRVKMGILNGYIVSRLEDIGHGNIFIGKYFPNEVMFKDLEDLTDTQVVEIHQIGDRYYAVILRELGIK